jgi:hypothetical protein
VIPNAGHVHLCRLPKWQLNGPLKPPHLDASRKTWHMLEPSLSLCLRSSIKLEHTHHALFRFHDSFVLPFVLCICVTFPASTIERYVSRFLFLFFLTNFPAGCASQCTLAGPPLNLDTSDCPDSRNFSCLCQSSKYLQGVINCISSQCNSSEQSDAYAQVELRCVQAVSSLPRTIATRF